MLSVAFPLRRGAPVSKPYVTLVTICREPLAVTLRFLAWHRNLGVDRVLLYLDDPRDPVLPWIAGKDWITPISCDADFWAGQGVSATAAFPARQLAALTHGYRQVSEGWVAVADADELFYFGGRKVQDILALQPANLRGLRIGTAEYVGSETGLHFRLPMTKPQVNAVYGPDAALFRPTEGLIGHRAGKSITRASLKLRRMRPHWAVGRRERDLTDLRLGPDETAALLHFVNTDFQGWRAKLAWRLAALGGISPRVKLALQAAMASASDHEAELQALFARLHRVTPDRIEILRKSGVHLAVEDDMLARTRGVFQNAPDPFAAGLLPSRVAPAETLL